MWSPMSEGGFINPIVDILSGEEQPPEWLIPDLFLQGSLVCLAGEAGAGKSYISYMLALAMAGGLPMFGGLFPASEPKRVLYFDEENGRQERDKYLRRAYNGLLAQGHEVDMLKLHDNFWPAHFELQQSNEWQVNAEDLIRQMQPHCLIFDTATPAFQIEEENDNSEAQRVIKDIRTLMAITDPVTMALVLRHAKMSVKGGKRTMRGAKAWHSAVDAVLFQVKAQGRPRKGGLNLTRLEPDKVRAYGLRDPIYITPEWTDKDQNGLSLTGSYSASGSHQDAEDEEAAEKAAAMKVKRGGGSGRKYR